MIQASSLDSPFAAGLADRVRRFGEARVLVLGDVMLDRYVDGSVLRLSPEAPIPVLRPANSRATLGGAANVALNAATLGAQVTLVGVIGDDWPGSELSRLVARNQGIRSGLVIAPQRPTTVKTRFSSGGHQMLRLDEETTDPIGGDVVAEVLDRFNAALETAEIVVLSDYAKGVLCDAVLATVLKMTSARGVVVIADPKRSDFSCYRGATILTPNEGEAHLGTRIEARDDLGAERAGRMALDSVGAKAVLVTRAAKGVTLVSADAPTLHLRAHAKEVADVSGAGDTFVAVLAVALSGGTPVSEAAALANIAAGISVGKRGTATVTRDEIFAALLLENFVRTDRKVVPWDQAAASVAIWHANGLKVGFANGCFDLLHPGHIRLLTEARKHCERLIVALNTDASVRRLKGRNRPVQTESSRATVMASLAAVDLVVMFGEDTPLELIRALRPDVLVKGSDYTEDRVVGADLVRDWGGQLLLVDLYDNHSTTATIRELTTSALSEPAK